MFARLVRRIANTRYVRSAMEDQADLSLFRQKPGPRVIWGLVVVGISYTIGWPAIAVLGLISAHAHAPMIVLVGGPIAYGLSHLVFILGAWLAGAAYAQGFIRWAVRVGMEKLMKRLRPSA